MFRRQRLRFIYFYFKKITQLVLNHHVFFVYTSYPLPPILTRSANLRPPQSHGFLTVIIERFVFASPLRTPRSFTIQSKSLLSSDNIHATYLLFYTALPFRDPGMLMHTKDLEFLDFYVTYLANM